MTDAQERSAVATCQSLHQCGYRVGAASSERPAPAQWSRFARARYRIPDPRNDSRAFARRVAEVVEEGEYAALLPGSDASLLAVSEHRDLFDDDFVLGLPSPNAVLRCISKVDLIEAAADVGLPVPETIVATESEGAFQAAERFGFPLLLKPRSTVFEHDGGMKQHSSTMIWEPEVLDERLPEFGFPCLLQRCDAGSLVSFAGVIADGSLLGVAFSRYTRTLPQDAGSVSFSQTEEPPATMVDRVRQMLSSLGWQGIFELELIETEPGRFAVIDFNPRLYGSVALAVGAGAPLPAIWCDWLLRGEANACVAQPGFSYRWEDAELRNLLAYLREGRIAAAADIIRPRRHSTKAYFHWTDPGPLLARAVGGVLNKSIGKGPVKAGAAPETERAERVRAWRQL